MKSPTRRQLAGMIDHAVLQPDATLDDLRAACRTARPLGVRSLCARPCDVACAAELLGSSGVAVGTVIGFPHGASHPHVKIAETLQAVADGANEMDMVINIGRLRDGDAQYVQEEIAGVVRAAGGRCVKVILECCCLNEPQIIAGCLAAERAGSAFVKTSTGFGSHGATVEHVRLLRRQVSDRLGVKAAGGIRTLADALAMIEAGADRLGTSSTEDILAEAQPDR